MKSIFTVSTANQIIIGVNTHPQVNQERPGKANTSGRDNNFRIDNPIVISHISPSFNLNIKLMSMNFICTSHLEF